jgi:hypothetical protein
LRPLQLAANATDPDGDTLLYKWSTNGGRIIGDGANVNWDLFEYTLTALKSESTLPVPQYHLVEEPRSSKVLYNTRPLQEEALPCTVFNRFPCFTHPGRKNPCSKK